MSRLKPIIRPGEKGRSKVAKKKVKYLLKRMRDKAYTDFVDARKVKFMREAAGMTKTQAAKAIGWSAQKWGDFERARHPNPRIGTLLAVCEALGCELQDLLKR